MGARWKTSENLDHKSKFRKIAPITETLRALQIAGDNQVSGRCERVLHRSFGRRSVVVDVFFFFFFFGRSGRAGLGWGLGC